MRHLSRRDLLRASLFGGLYTGAHGRLPKGLLSPFGLSDALAQGVSEGSTSLGQPLKNRYFVLCMFNGGWDTLVSLDPRDPSVFTDQAAVDTKITLGYERLNGRPALDVPSVGGVYLPNRLSLPQGQGLAPLGAFMGDLATPAYINDIAVVRGVNMSTLAHDVGKVRARTGRPPSGNQPRGSSVGTWLARHYSRGELIPNLSIGEEVYNLDQPLEFDVFEVNTPLDLRDALTLTSASAQLREGTLASVEGLLEGAYPCGGGASQAHSSSWMSAAKLGLRRTRSLLDLQLGELLNIAADTEAMSALRGRFGFGTSATDLRSPAAKAALASLALTTGLSRVVHVDLVGELDTHYGSGGSQNWLEQGARQLSGWQAIARLIDELKRTPVLDGSGESFFERTTIVAYSDFGRTAMLNPSGGRDHWLTSSYLLAGADIAGGLALGASSDVGMTPGLIDPRTGLVSAINGEELRPAHVWQSLLYAAGLHNDPADLRVPPLLPLLRGHS